MENYTADQPLYAPFGAAMAKRVTDVAPDMADAVNNAEPQNTAGDKVVTETTNEAGIKLVMIAYVKR